MLQNVVAISPSTTPKPEHIINIPPFGAYPPTPAQSWIRRVFHSTPLGFMRIRRPFVERFKHECAGPVDSYLFGMKVRFHPHDNQTDAKSAVCGNCYNSREWRWVAKCLPMGGNFVDIGANMGFFSLFAATRRARIVAIEPHPVLFARLGVNMAFNGIDACLVRAAVGARDETGMLVQTNSDYGGGTIGTGDGERVRIRPLLDILNEAGMEHVDVLKIDIEGYEDRALIPFLRTAPDRLLPRHIIMEYSERDRWHGDLMDARARAGYRRRARSRGNILLSRRARG